MLLSLLFLVFWILTVAGTLLVSIASNRLGWLIGVAVAATASLFTAVLFGVMYALGLHVLVFTGAVALSDMVSRRRR